MSTSLDGHAVSRPSVSGDVPGRGAGGTWPAPDLGDHALDDGCEVLILLDVTGPHPVVSVVGALERPGGALLAAVLEYVRRAHGGLVTVDLSLVSAVDRHGLGPVIATGAAVEGASLRVDRVLTGLAGSLLPAGVSRRASAGSRHPARSPDSSVGDEAS